MKHLIVISMDALIYEDLVHLQDKPAFGYLLKNGALVERLRSIYPALTYPCHTTMVTGCFPAKHGILGNTAEMPGEPSLPWLFEHSAVKCPDFLDACHAAGLSTASVGWPVSGHHPSVDYLVGECWPLTGGSLDDYRRAYLETGTPEELFLDAVEKHLPLRVGRKQPESSYFLTYVSAEIIRRYRPNVLMLHQGNVDSFRHKTGVFSPLVTEGVLQCEEMLGILIEATKEAGIFDDTTFVVTADHGHLDVVRTVHPNVLLSEHGLIKTDENHAVTHWDAWCYYAEMSARVVLRDPSDTALYQKVRAILDEAAASGLWGISRVYTREETAKEEGLDGDFAFVIETDGSTKFDEAWYGPGATPMALGAYSAVHGSHGYHPDKGPRPSLIACGPGIKKGARVAHAGIVDLAPTLSAIMGVSLPEADGHTITEILTEA